ncbi:hypothetical protein GCM10029964_029620 [Kibdelosporangium lantanae]
MTTASSTLPRTTWYRKPHTAAVKTNAHPTSIITPTGHSGVSCERSWKPQTFAVPSRYPANETPAAVQPPTRGANSKAGSGASQVSAVIGAFPVPK